MTVKEMEKLISAIVVLIMLTCCAGDQEAMVDALVLGMTRTRPYDGMTMVYVPAGQFGMGTSDAQLDNAMQVCFEMYDEDKYCKRSAYGSEQPVHTVALDAFWIDQTEVTNSQFLTFLRERGNQAEDGISWLEPGAGHNGIVYGYVKEIDGKFRIEGGYEDYPVIEVSWYGAAAYCDWVGGRLPTEAEWEYAARGPDSHLYPWGNTFDGARVNYRDASFTSQAFGQDRESDDGYARWAPVGSYPDGGSWCGALDMAGNVWEWVSDRWSANYYGESPETNPEGPASGDLRIGRGGSWFDERWHVRSNYRKGLSPSSSRMHWIGFRCVVPADS